MNNKRLFGMLGIAGTAVLFIAIVVAIILFEDGVLTPLNGFVTELGLYPGGYLTVSSALIFNIGLALFGAVLCVLMVSYGIRQNSWMYAAVSFFGILTGILAIASAVFTLNFASYHYIICTAFYAGIFVFGAIFIIAGLVTGRGSSIAQMIVAFLAAVSGAIFAGYVATGGMTQVFIEDASQVGRLAVMPFALVGWVSLALTMVLVVLLCIDFMADAETERYSRPSRNLRQSMRDIEL